MDENLAEIKETLKKYGQEHLLNGYDQLDEKTQKKLLEQIKNTDFALIKSLYENTAKEEKKSEEKVEPINYLDKYKLKDQFKHYQEVGEKAIKQGKLAAVTMAGGQGTRLGHSGPKGTFKLNVFGEEKSLFQILSENLKEANNKYNMIIPWYIMTSKENHKETYDFLEKNNYFGYEKNNVMLFSQGELPLVNIDGEMLIR